MDKGSMGLREAVHGGDREATGRWVRARLAPRERAGVIGALTQAEAGALVNMLDARTFAALLGQLRPSDGIRLLEHTDVAVAAAALEELAPDQAADLVQAGDGERLLAVMGVMDPTKAAALADLVRWPPETAGGRMTPAFVAVAPDVRADGAIAELHHVAAKAETISYVYVVAAGEQLQGVLSLRRLMLSPPDTAVARLMDADIVAVSPLTDQEEAARLLTEHHLIAIPVVEDGQILGIITVDDVADILKEETAEDFSRLGGSEPLAVPYLQASPALLWRKRVFWLLALFVAEAYTGTVLRYFEDDLQATVTLAFFVPLLIGTGGNVGSQIVTTLVAAMAIGEVRLADLFRVIRKETSTGAMIAVVLAAATFLRASMLEVGYDVATVVTITIVAIVLWASLVGAILPLILRRLGIDPAVVSTPFITTLVDGTGLLIYFWTARLIL